METELSQGLTFLVWTCSIFLIIVGIFVIKLLFDLSRLAVSLKKSADIVHTELDPIMKNVNQSTTTINNFVQGTSKRVGKITDLYDHFSDAVITSVTKVSALSGFLAKSAVKGAYSALKNFLKKK